MNFHPFLLLPVLPGLNKPLVGAVVSPFYFWREEASRQLVAPAVVSHALTAFTLAAARFIRTGASAEQLLLIAFFQGFTPFIEWLAADTFYYNTKITG